MCAIDWSLIEIKQFLYAIHQHSEKGIDIHCKVTFGLKYIVNNYPMTKNKPIHYVED